MSSTVTILEDLYSWNSWANSRLIELSQGLSDAELDAQRPLGLGSLRNTLYHILGAEELWFERWNGDPWRAFPLDASDLPLSTISERLISVTQRRAAMLEAERADNWQRVVTYKDLKGNAWSGRLKDLAMHVANHGAHHRAQALSYLRGYGRTVPGGLDYLFFRLAFPFIEQDAETTTQLRTFGLPAGQGSGRKLVWDHEFIMQYFVCGDWANDQLLPLVQQLNDAALDRDWNMGMGTIRKTVLHIQDAERWWMKNWTIGPAMYESSPPTTTIAEYLATETSHRAARTQFIRALDAAGADRVVSVRVGPLELRVPIIESLVQLGGHGTHHRAQLINMLKQSGLTPPQVDHIFWQRATGRAVSLP